MGMRSRLDTVVWRVIKLGALSPPPTPRLGTYSSPKRKCVSETRVGYRVGQGFHFRLFQKQCGGGLYRSRYTYFSNLVARTRLPQGLLEAPRSRGLRCDIDMDLYYVFLFSSLLSGCIGLEVINLPVGQGDCSVIRCDNGNYVLIDCGKAPVRAIPQGESSPPPTGWSVVTISNYLKSIVQSITAIIITHADLDHYNMLPSLEADHLTKLKYVVIGGNRGQYNINEWFRKLEKRNVAIENVSGGNPCIGPNCKISGNQAPKLDFCYENTNNFEILAANIGNELHKNQQSIVLKVIGRYWSMLFPGDMEGRAASVLAAKKDLLKSDVYRIAHHGGSSQANRCNFINAIKPQIGVVSNPYRSAYNHPTCEALQRVLTCGKPQSCRELAKKKKTKLCLDSFVDPKQPVECGITFRLPVKKKTKKTVKKNEVQRKKIALKKFLCQAWCPNSPKCCTELPTIYSTGPSRNCHANIVTVHLDTGIVSETCS